MRIANSAVREINGDPCSIAPFGVVVVNTTSDEIVCVAANRVGLTGSEWWLSSGVRRELIRNEQIRLNTAKSLGSTFAPRC